MKNCLYFEEVYENCKLGRISRQIRQGMEFEQKKLNSKFEVEFEVQFQIQSNSTVEFDQNWSNLVEFYKDLVIK